MTEFDAPPFLAIVGMAGRFPGMADVEQFWERISAGEISITRSDPDGDTGFISASGVVEGADQFDAGFFGFSLREALLLDPQHRVFMECSWEALEHAGCDTTRYFGTVGVFGGSGDTGHYSTLRSHRGRFPGVSAWQLRLASGSDFLTSRVAYKLGLSGPAVTVQTACSTSLVAVHMAAQALLAGECDLALAGGVTIRGADAELDDSGGDAPMTRDGWCLPFDAAATGTVASDGAGVVVLKRLEDAIAEGDHIHAVLRGSAINNDGSGKVGFTTPSVDGQAAAVAIAHLVADAEASTIGYVEAHGTGTPVGDPIEVRALSKAFGPHLPPGTCVLGSVKGNIGHTDAAAGVIGLIKAALVLENELIPPTARYRTPNPELGLEESPFTVTSAATAWPRTGTPRRAGVNSLGIGGTNAHVVLEEAPSREPDSSGRPYQLLPLSARSSTALASAARRLADRLAVSTAPLADVAWTLQTGRREFTERGFVVATDGGDAGRALRGDQPGQFVTARYAGRPSQVAFLFPGQGGQHTGMARDLYEHEPVFRAEIDRCARQAASRLGFDFRAVLYPDGVDDSKAAPDQLESMATAQPALFAVEYALARLWQSWGVQPTAVVGHSLGAYAAATIAGVFDPNDAMDLVIERSRLLAGLPAGAMLAVPLTEQELLPRLTGRLSIAAINGPQQCVVTGPVDEVEQLREQITGEGLEGRLLRIPAAGHSVLVEEVMTEFEKRVTGIELHPPTIPWISDMTGASVSAAEASSPHYWTSHLRHTVRFSQALETLLAADGNILLEVGPGRTLGNLARRHPVHTPDLPILQSLRHPSDLGRDSSVLLTAAGRMWQAGVPINWQALHEGERRYRTPLPAYPFERQRFRLDAEDSPATTPADASPATGYQGPDTSEEYMPMASDTERAVAEAFGEVLGLSEVGTNDNFFDLGGDSLVAMQLRTLLRTALGTEIPVRTVFQAPTVAMLAQAIDMQETK